MSVRNSVLISAAAVALVAGQSPAFAQSVAPVAADPAEGARPVSAMASEVSPFATRLNPYYGDISAFWRDITAFYGNIAPWWGDISAFRGGVSPSYGDIAAFRGNLSPFWRDITAFWGDISAFWKTTDATWASGGFVQAADNLKTLSARSEAVWGKTVQARTGKSFTDAVANPLFAKYGIDPNRPDTLRALSPERRMRFFLDWHDSLMSFSGADQVDYWMKAINWSPALTQVQGSGADVKIGLIDFAVAGDRDVQRTIKWYGGVSNFSNGHGAAVASLMVADHDGQGVMGIAPQASVIAYNPFDRTGTADWKDIRKGVGELIWLRAKVINLSLGVKGWTLHPDWQRVFSDKKIAPSMRDTIFVLAAGNDGVTQTRDVPWSWAYDPNLIVVGSVGPDGQISPFSNRPGEACLLNAGKCANETDKLKYRFMVAPGELILVSDDKGGVERQSGTSFAAPLVSGTVALIHDRWPWLRNEPDVVTQIILSTAKDLGAPGVDPVYGWGLLDATAAMSVIDASKLQIWLYDSSGKKKLIARDIRAMRSRLNSGFWNSTNAYVTVFEPLKRKYRDYVIPLSTQLGGTVKTKDAGVQQFQSFLQQWLFTLIRNQKFNDAETYTSPSGWSFTEESAIALQDDSSLRRGAPIYYRFSGTTPSGRGTITYGFGAGALGLARQSGFALQSDYGLSTGGVNPLLGFASGGPFAAVGYKLAPNLALTAGASRDGWDEVWTQDAATPLTVGLIKDLRPYHAGAVDIGLAWDATPGLVLKANYTRLKEQDALLGVQSQLDGYLSRGSTTEGLTLGADATLPYGLRLAASGSVGRSLPTKADAQSLSVTADGLKTSAWQVAVTKAGLFDKADGLRLSLAQTLHVSDGELEHASVQVVDRSTGEIGLVRERIRVTGGERAYAAQAVYVRSLMDGKAELQGYARFDTAAAADPSKSDATAGLSFKVRY